MGPTLIHVGLFNDYRGLQYYRICTIPWHFARSFMRDSLLVYHRCQCLWPRILRMADGYLDGVYHHCSRQWAHGPIHYAHV